MATPDFILELRRHIGHSPLWLSGVTAVVTDPARSRVVLVRRSDNGRWTPVTGILDPGEEPAQGAVREVREETGIRARPQRLVQVGTTGLVTHANGDQAQYLDLCFHLVHEEGEPHPADEESTEACWFPVDQLPPMAERFRASIAHALAGESAARFVP